MTTLIINKTPVKFRMMIPTFTGVSLLEIHTKMFCKNEWLLDT